MTDPEDSPLPAAAETPPPPIETPAQKVRNERALRLAAALRVNLRRRKIPTTAPRDDRH